MRSDILPVLQVASLGHAMAAFVNGEYVGKNTYTRTHTCLYQSLKMLDLSLYKNDLSYIDNHRDYKIFRIWTW